MRVVEQIKDAMTRVVSVVLGIAVLVVVAILSLAIEFFPQLLVALLLVWFLRHL